MISGGHLVSRIYEGSYIPASASACLIFLGKYHVDLYIKEIGLPACFLYTGNFYENMILRNHVRYNAETQEVEFHQAVIQEDTQCL
jgi:hypothetical protein